MADIFELDSYDFEKAIIKNKLIKQSMDEWIGFADNSITGKEELLQILEEMSFLLEYDVVVFGKDCFDGEVSLLELLECPKNNIFALCFRRELLVQTGSFNELLEGSTNYEFILRAAEAGRIYVVSCDADKALTVDAFTMAYIMRRYMPYLKECGRLNDIYLRILELTKNFGVSVEYNNTMNLFMENTKEYERILENTAPFLILVGTDICAGVLVGFANSLADELVGLGQAVISTNGRWGKYNEIPTDMLMKGIYKAIIGFQAPAMGKKIMQGMKGRRIQFLFDNPAFLGELFEEYSDNVFFLCQDAFYAEYIREYYGFPNAIQFPPGGTVVEKLPSEKIYDVVFIGNYESFPECPYRDEFEMGYYEYMLNHSESTFEKGLYEFGRILGVEFTKEDIRQLLRNMKDLCLNILHKDRHAVIETILSEGISLHVFSDNWKMYQGNGSENLIIHPMIFGEEPYRVWSQSKIGLNIMRGHKAGMTERIANIMLCGACCLSDETTYLTEYFNDGEDIVLFNRRELYALPEKIKYLLEHDEERERIAIAGQKRAFEELTWRKRAEGLLGLLAEW